MYDHGVWTKDDVDSQSEHLLHDKRSGVLAAWSFLKPRKFHKIKITRNPPNFKY
jgi:hypothetical protein